MYHPFAPFEYREGGRKSSGINRLRVSSKRTYRSPHEPLDNSEERCQWVDSSGMVVELYKKAKSLTIRACLESSIKNCCKEIICEDTKRKRRHNRKKKETKKNNKRDLYHSTWSFYLPRYTFFQFSFIFSFPLFFPLFYYYFSFFFLFLYVLSLPSYFAAGLSHSLSPLHAFFFSHSDFSHLNFSRSFSATCLFLSSILILFSRSFTFAFIFHVHISYSFISDIIPFLSYSTGPNVASFIETRKWLF